jgi:hypothetical protein
MTSNRAQPLNLNASDDPTADAVERTAPLDDSLQGAARHAYWWALALPVFWAAGLLAFNQGFERPSGVLTLPGVQAAVLLALAVTPVGVALFAAYVIRQGARLAAEARLTRVLAEEMATPALMAAALNGRAVTDVLSHIAEAEAAASRAREAVLALRQALAEDSRELVEATAEAARTGERLRRTLGGERAALETLNAQLGQQADRIEAALQGSITTMADASDLAQAQLGEAEAALTARAAGLEAAGGSALAAGRVAAEDLARQTLRLEDAAGALAEQTRQVEAGLNTQRAALADAAEALWREHDRRAQVAQEQQQRLDDALIAVRFGAADIGEQSSVSAEALRDLSGQRPISWNSSRPPRGTVRRRWRPRLRLRSRAPHRPPSSTASGSKAKPQRSARRCRQRPRMANARPTNSVRPLDAGWRNSAPPRPWRTRTRPGPSTPAWRAFAPRLTGWRRRRSRRPSRPTRTSSAA